MKNAFFEQIENAQTVLLIGAGGGFDVYVGLPLYFWLRNSGKAVHLANLSFTELGFCDGERLTPSLMKVVPGTSGPANYFPEVYLSQWLSKRFGETPIYAIERTGYKPTAAAYERLSQLVRPDALVLVDGGMDSLMRGDEAGLGTPQEDMVSLAAAQTVNGIPKKFLVSIGFGIDTFHGVCHAHFLENVAALIKEGGYLGAWSLAQEMEEFRLYKELNEFVTARMPRQPSIVNSSIISAVDGWFGDYHATKRTSGSQLFINPLMALYWAFELEKVARRNLYLDKIRDTETYPQLSMAIESFRALQQKIKLWQEIPC